MNPPRVSVLMSVYNGERYLRYAIESILVQTFTNFEFIIVDDYSTDRTPEILDQYTDPRIVRLKNDTNLGLTKSLNRGLAVARGQYVARQDADDVSLPERFERQGLYLETHSECVLVGTAYDLIGDQGEVMVQITPLTESQAIKPALQTFNRFVHGSVMMRRDSLMQVGGYREAFKRSQDYDLWLRLTERYEVANLPEVLYQFRQTKETISFESFSEQEAYAEITRICARRRQAGIAEELDILVANLSQYMPKGRQHSSGMKNLAYWRYAYGRRLLKEHRLSEARQQFLLSLGVYFWQREIWPCLAVTFLPRGLVRRLQSVRHRLAGQGQAEYG